MTKVMKHELFMSKYYSFIVAVVWNPSFYNDIKVERTSVVIRELIFIMMTFSDFRTQYNLFYLSLLRSSLLMLICKQNEA